MTHSQGKHIGGRTESPAASRPACSLLLTGHQAGESTSQCAAGTSPALASRAMELTAPNRPLPSLGSPQEPCCRVGEALGWAGTRQTSKKFFFNALRETICSTAWPGPACGGGRCVLGIWDRVKLERACQARAHRPWESKWGTKREPAWLGGEALGARWVRGQWEGLSESLPLLVRGGWDLPAPPIRLAPAFWHLACGAETGQQGWWVPTPHTQGLA